MNIVEALALLGITVSLAAIPSTSVALVVTRSATSGIGNGVAVAAGVVFGDLIFIFLVILGLSVIAETMGNLFLVIKYMGAMYLLWLGFSLMKAAKKTEFTSSAEKEKGSLVASFLSGCALTLGDFKAIVFYISLFPMLIDLSALKAVDVLVVVFITILGVGSVKIFYAFSAHKIASLAKDLKLDSAMRRIAGGLMIGAGSYIIAKA